MKKLLPWLGLGFLIRIVLILTTIHPDIRGFGISGYIISQEGGLFTLYDYMSRLPSDNPLVGIYGVDLFIYPPLVYQIIGLFMKVLSPFYNFDLLNRLFLDMSAVLGDKGLPGLLFLLKLLLL